MTRTRMIGIAMGLLACAAAAGQPVGAVRGQGQVAMNGRAVQRSAAATYLKTGDEVVVQTGKAVLDLVGGTRLYLDAGSRVKLEAGSRGEIGVRMLAGNGAFRLGEGASVAGLGGARQGLIAVERTLARVYPMVSMVPVTDAGGGRAASAMPPIRSVDISTSTLAPAPPAPGTTETPQQPQSAPTPGSQQPAGTFTQSSLFVQANGQPATQYASFGTTGQPSLGNFLVLLPQGAGGVAPMSLSGLSRDDEAMWWLAGAPVARKSAK